jgi:hypothetical protein
MSSIDIRPEENTAAIGMRGTGKTELAQQIADAQPSDVAIVAWDPKRVWPDQWAYHPSQFDVDELDQLAARCMQALPCRLFLEEIEQLLKNQRSLPENVRRFALMCREYGGTFHLDLRIPQRVSKTLLDEADHILLFKVSGRRLNYMHRYLGRPSSIPLGEPGMAHDLPGSIDADDDGHLPWEAIRKLPKDPREDGGWFVHVHEGRLILRRPLDV